MRVFHQNESCLSCLHPPLSYERRREQGRQLSFWWKTLNLIGHYGIFPEFRGKFVEGLAIFKFLAYNNRFFLGKQQFFFLKHLNFNKFDVNHADFLIVFFLLFALKMAENGYFFLSLSFFMSFHFLEIWRPWVLSGAHEKGLSEASYRCMFFDVWI